MQITGNTRITGLFGYPVEHSLSPPMHNAAFDHLGLDFCYLTFSVHPDFLKAAVESVRALDMVGVNLTVPHKETVIPLLDSLDDEAAFIGAVNTIVNSEGKLTGFNTDGRGFLRSLKEHNIHSENKNILIVGAGGASRAISYYLSKTAFQLHLFDIDRNKSDKLISDLGSKVKNVFVLPKLNNLEKYEVLVNATPLGLKKNDPLPFDVSALTDHQVVCDLIYKNTRLLDHAAQRGCRTLDGSGMLLWQGALAFELWTHVLPPIDIMKKALLGQLK
jgi:shikimate dehydrogenase